MIITKRKIEIGNIQKWEKSSKANEKRQAQKERIREAYKNGTTVEVIPAKAEQKSDNMKRLRVAAYCRVSTDEDAQASSYELQLQHYREMIINNPDWELVDIYADEGISGTSTKRRVNFLRMIDDCYAGKVDMIITKSVSRFARNTLDCLDNVRKLKALDPPVGVFFETEGFNTAESKNEFTLGIMSLVAQGESEQKSASIRWSIIQRFKKGIPIIPTQCLLGYDKDKFGNLFIIPEEAEAVKYIFACYLDGLNAREIANALTESHVPTAKNNAVWSSSAVLSILRNEKYCGDVLMQKTYTVDCFTHKAVKNTGQVPQYRLRDHHPAIVPRDDWLLVQEQLKHRRHSSQKKEVPIEKKFYVHRVKGGLLRGFAIINPKWDNREVALFLQKIKK